MKDVLVGSKKNPRIVVLRKNPEEVVSPRDGNPNKFRVMRSDLPLRDFCDPTWRETAE